uniref:Uncharacterized protein n=1 Tax=Arundo donax TaxID=35708 RepID=A0A0A9CUQ8_ARUDO
MNMKLGIRIMWEGTHSRPKFQGEAPMIPRIRTMIEGGEERTRMIGILQEDITLMLLLMLYPIVQVEANQRVHAMVSLRDLRRWVQQGVLKGERVAGRCKDKETKRKRLHSGGRMRFMLMGVVVLLELTQEKPTEMINQTEGGTISCEIIRTQMMLNGGMHRKG